MSLPTKEGHLGKHRQRKGWQQYYFKLNRTYLQYFIAQHAPSPKKSVLRVDVVGICLNETMGERNCFDIVFKSGDRWVMSAGSEHELKDWKKVLLAHQLPQEVAEFDKRKLLEDEGITEPSLPVPPLPSYMRDTLTEEKPPPYNISNP